MTAIKEADFVGSLTDAIQFISTFHPADFVRHLTAAYEAEESPAAREHFYSKPTGKSSAQVKAAWSRLVFSGKGTPPKELGSSADVKKFVAANADAIGYIEKSAVDGSVKVVLSVD